MEKLRDHLPDIFGGTLAVLGALIWIYVAISAISVGVVSCISGNYLVGVICFVCALFCLGIPSAVAIWGIAAAHRPRKKKKYHFGDTEE